MIEVIVAIIGFAVLAKCFFGIARNAAHGDPIGTKYSKETGRAISPAAHGREKEKLRLLAPQYLKIVQDCVNIVNTTTDATVFFNRYDLMIEKLDELADMEATIRFAGTKPSLAYYDFIHQKEQQTNLFIDRVYDSTRSKILSLTLEKAKINNADKFYNILKAYEDKMSPGCMKHIEDRYKELLSLCSNSAPKTGKS